MLSHAAQPPSPVSRRLEGIASPTSFMARMTSSGSMGQQMPESATFKCYYDFVDNHKVTFAEDLGVYEQLMKHRLIKDIIDK